MQPCARPTNLATLNRKRLAVDASIWIYQFLKAVRDKEGNALRNSHVVGFFRRICKLLWYGIQPVFVFDGGAPALKRATLQGRRRRREGRREDATRTAGKLLAVQMQRLAEEEEEKRKRRIENPNVIEQEEEQLPDMEHIVYADELGMSQQERQKTRRFHKQDAYHLPELTNGIEGMGKPDDPRIMSVEELEEYARQFQNGEDINLYDFSKIDFDGEFFKSLPPPDRYNILNAARIRSRLRMGLSKDQLDDMFPDRMAFSRFQIERVKERNHITQRLMFEMGMTGTDLTLGVNARVAGEKNREYILVRNEGAEGGWALGVVSRDKERGQIHKPIDVDELDFQYQDRDEDDDWEDDEEFEDVPIPGVNRLPKLNQRSVEEVEDAEESLFVSNDTTANLFGDEDIIGADEDEDLNLAIAMSLHNQHGAEVQEEEEDVGLQDAPAPEWAQKAVEAPKPIVSTTGRMVAHIVNNRANAAVPRRRESSASSDSDMDLQSALAAARKKQKPVQRVVEKTPIRPNVKSAFDGPLPFEKLSWGGMFSSTKPKQPVPTKPAEKPKNVETAELEAESEDDAGGFEREPQQEKEDGPMQLGDRIENAPRPLPPWLADTTDIRESVKQRRQVDIQLNAEDEEMAREEENLLRQRREAAIVEIESSGDDNSDIEILDAPPPRPRQAPLKQPGASLPSLDDDIAMETGSPPVGQTKDNRPAYGGLNRLTRRSPSPGTDAEEEFEDVVVPDPPTTSTLTLTLARKSEAARIEAELFGDSPPPADEDVGFDAADGDGIIDPDAPAAEEFDDFSDPEEEELLAQMAEEAEEHARFASQLNNKSQLENQVSYEQELRALRSQQKKDRRDADEVTHIMVTECQALLRLFGIPYITAPMEAEAQCAELVRLNLVDGIVTDDSDTFLFGGTRVYKNMFNSNKFVECYLAKDLESEMSLSRDQLISLAQLLGSDYTEGIPGVGPVTALEVLSEFTGKDGLEGFKEWWQDVQQHNRPKEVDATSSFRRKFRKSQATKLFLPLGFPSPAVVEAYLQPEVDSNPEKFQWGVPDLEGLRQFLMTTIGWSQERTDEVLVPVIKDMNKRQTEGTQSNITRYFEGSTGTGASKEAFAPRQRAKGSKRMADAVSKLRANTGGLSTALPVMAMSSEPKPKRKRKARGPVVVENDENENDDGVDDEEANDSGPAKQRGTATRGRGRGRGKGKRSKASSS